MFIVAVIAGSLALGRLLREGLSRPMAAGLVCLIVSVPMLAVLIEFMLTFRSPD